MDVANHFGLSSLPFRATVAPRDAWIGGRFSAALAELLARLRAGDALVALAGPIGTGKSLALRIAAERLGDAGEQVRHFGHADQLAGELPTGGILIVDEAEGVDPDRLREMTEAAGDRYQLVLAGEGSFLAGLQDAPPVTPIWLAPLDRRDAADFVRDRLGRSGKPALFDEPAIERASQLGGGVPRQIGAIAGAALLEAALDGAPAVAAEHVERAGAMRASFSPSRPFVPPERLEPIEKAAPAVGAPLPAIAASPAAVAPPANVSALARPSPTARRGRLAAAAAAVVALAVVPLWAVLQQPEAEAPKAEAPETRTLEAGRPAVVVPPSQPPIAPATPMPAEQSADPRPPAVDNAAATAPQAPASPPPEPRQAAGAPEAPAAAPQPRQTPMRPMPAPRRPSAAPERPAPAPYSTDPPIDAPAAVGSGAGGEESARGAEREPASPVAPAELPTPRAEPAAASQCACPPGMSAARCLEWKAWRACRSRD